MAQCVYCQAETELYENNIPICISCSNARTEPKRKPPVTAPPLRDSLLEDILATTARMNEARRGFDLVMGHFPSGLPHPDGSQQIKNASRELEFARKEMGRAHDRLNDFLNSGTIPQDLKRAVGR